MLDFHWGGFFGNNPALQSIAQDFLFFNPELDSYQMQMERLGVDSYVNWHSCYLWLANDFTLLFVPLVIYYIAKFASVALRMYRTSHDLSSGIVFVVLANMLLFCSRTITTCHQYSTLLCLFSHTGTLKNINKYSNGKLSI